MVSAVVRHVVTLCAAQTMLQEQMLCLCLLGK